MLLGQFDIIRQAKCTGSYDFGCHIPLLLVSNNFFLVDMVMPAAHMGLDIALKLLG